MADSTDWRPKTAGLVTDQFWYMRENSILTDVTFLVGPEKQKVECHKLVLARASSVFHAMFYGPIAEKGDVELSDTEKKLFLKLIKFVYCDKVNIKSCRQALELCYMGNKYMLERLVAACVDFLCANLEIRVFWKTCELAGLIDNEQLKSACLLMLQLHTLELLNDASFEDLSRANLIFLLQENHLHIKKQEIGLIKFVLEWGMIERKRQNKPESSLREILGPEIMKLLRFLTLTHKQFTDNFATSDLLNENEKMAIIINITGGDYTIPDTISSNKDVRNIDSLSDVLNKKLILKRSLKYSEETFKRSGCGSEHSIYSFNTTQDMWLHGLEFYTQKSIGKKRKLNEAPTFTDYYYENINFKLEKITYKTTKIATSEILINVDFKESCLHDSTARVMFDKPLYLESNSSYIITAKIMKTGTYFIKCGVCKPLKYLTTDFSIHELGNVVTDCYVHDKDNFFSALIFFALFSKSVELASTDEETDVKKCE